MFSSAEGAKIDLNDARKVGRTFAVKHSIARDQSDFLKMNFAGVDGNFGVHQRKSLVGYGILGIIRGRRG